MDRNEQRSRESGAQPSSITYDKSGNAVTFSGPDAVELYRAGLLHMHIGLWIKTKMIPTRGVTITRMLAMASEFTGKRYTHKQAAQACADLDVWIKTMKAALPSVTEGERR